MARAALIVLAGFWIYWTALHGAWVWDDVDLVTRDESLRSLAGLRDIWRHTPISNYWPLTWTLFWVEWHLWGLNVVGYHAVSLSLHLLSAFLLWRLLQQLGLRWAWLAGLLFAIHPVAVESVAWISETKNTLSLPFYLLSLIAFINFDRSGRRSSYAFALLFYLAAMLSKTSTVMLPAVLLLFCWWERGRVTRQDVRRILPFLAVAVVLGFSTVYFESTHAPVDHVVDERGLGGRLEVAVTAVAFYLGKIVWPSGLLPVYPRWSPSGLGPFALFAGILLAATVGLMWAKRRSWGRHALLGAGFFLLNLLPVLGFVRMDYMNISWVADHFVYLPMAGMIGVLVLGLETLQLRLPSARPLIAVGAAVLGGILAVESRIGATHWRDGETLWTYALEKNPDCWLAHCGLALAIQDIPGRRNEAIDHYEKAVRLKPDFIEAHNDLGHALADMPGRATDAIAQFSEALRLKPDYDVAHFNLGCVLDTIPGRQNEAIAQYEEALRLRPGFFEAHFNLGCALERIPGRSAEAAGQFEQAVILKPDDAEAHHNLGRLLVTAPGRLDEAVGHFAAAVRLQPDNAVARFDLGFALGRTPARMDEAIAQYREALRLKPDYAEAENNLGIALCREGRTAEGLTHIESAIRLRPDFTPARLTRASVLLQLGQRDEAIAEFNRVLTREPNNAAARKMLEELRAAP